MPTSCFRYADTHQPVLVGDFVTVTTHLDYQDEIGNIIYVHDADRDCNQTDNEYGVKVQFLPMRGFFLQPAKMILELHLVRWPDSREELEAVIGRHVFQIDSKSNLLYCDRIRQYLASLPHPDYPPSE